MRHLSGGLTVVRAQFAPNSVQFSSVQLNSVRLDWAGSGFGFGLLLHGAFISHGEQVEFIIPQQRAGESCQTVGESWRELESKARTHH